MKGAAGTIWSVDIRSTIWSIWSIGGIIGQMQITDGTQTILGGDDNLCGRATMLNGAIRFNNSVCATDAEGIGHVIVNIGARDYYAPVVMVWSQTTGLYLASS